MPSFFVETYLPRGESQERAARDLRVRTATDELTKGGGRVRFESSIYLPEDEICFFVFDAPSSREAALAARHGDLDPIRVVEVISSPEREPRDPRPRTTTHDDRRRTQ